MHYIFTIWFCLIVYFNCNFLDEVELCRKKLSAEGVKVPGIHDSPGESGRSALHYAVEANDIPCVKTFIKAGSDMNTKDKNGNTPLKSAITARFNLEKENRSNGSKCEVIVLLMENGARIEKSELDTYKRRKQDVFAECTEGNRSIILKVLIDSNKCILF